MNCPYRNAVRLWSMGCHGDSGIGPIGHRRSIWTDGKVVKAKAFTKKRR